MGSARPWWPTPLILTQRQYRLCEFEAALLYTLGSRPPRTIQRNCLKRLETLTLLTTREMYIKTTKRYCLILERMAVLRDLGNKCVGTENFQLPSLIMCACGGCVCVCVFVHVYACMHACVHMCMHVCGRCDVW